MLGHASTTRDDNCNENEFNKIDLFTKLDERTFPKWPVKKAHNKANRQTPTNVLEY